MDVSAGTRLGPYEILSPLGAGGMGEVWRARDPRIGREVAVKLLPESVISSPDRLRRFEQEARAAGSLNHPNLVTIHELGVHDGVPYIAMELLEGETLRDRLEANGARLPIRKAVELSIQIAGGLAAAHEKGIIHRDLKPENIFITRDGRVKILDFGLAKLQVSKEAASSGSGTAALTAARGTAPGTVMGTAGYMSPEQVRGQEVDHRTDIFAFGSILYEMLSGHRAFEGSSAVETMSAILKEDPPELAAGETRVSPSVERVVRRCLEKNPSERFDSAHDVAFALDAVTTASSSNAAQAIVAAPPRYLRNAMFGAIALLLAAAGFVAARLINPAPAPVEISFTQLTFQGLSDQPAIAPDGKSFAYVSRTAGEDDIYIQRIGGTNAIDLTKNSGVDNGEPAFSPDGQQIAFRSERDAGGIFVMGATGESVRRISDFGFNPAWSPDGKSIVCASEKINDPNSRFTLARLSVLDLATGQARQITTGADAVQPSWSPHGQRIAFWSVIKGRRVISTVPAEGGDPTAVIDDGMMNWNPVWSPDGRYLYFLSDRGGSMNVRRVAIDEKTGRLRGRPQGVTASPRWVGSLSMAQDGTMAVVTRSADRTIRAIPFDPVNLRFTGPPAGAGSGSRSVLLFDLSPDGKWIAFGTLGAQESIFVARIDGSELRQLTNDGFKNRGPRWSPDGKRLAFFSNRGGDYDIWTIDADGSGLQQMTFGPHLIVPVWTPDGRHMVGFDISRNRCGFLDAAPRSPIQWLPELSAYDFFPTAFSSDGRRLLASMRGKGSGSLLYDFDSRRYEILSQTAGRPMWLNDHAVLMSDEKDLYCYDLRTRKTAKIGPMPLEPLSPVTEISPDRKTIYYDSAASDVEVWMLKVAEAK